MSGMKRFHAAGIASNREIRHSMKSISCNTFDRNDRKGRHEGHFVSFMARKTAGFGQNAQMKDMNCTSLHHIQPKTKNKVHEMDFVLRAKHISCTSLKQKAPNAVPGHASTVRRRTKRNSCNHAEPGSQVPLPRAPRNRQHPSSRQSPALPQVVPEPVDGLLFAAYEQPVAE